MSGNMFRSTWHVDTALCPTMNAREPGSNVPRKRANPLPNVQVWYARGYTVIRGTTAAGHIRPWALFILPPNLSSLYVMYQRFFNHFYFSLYVYGFLLIFKFLLDLTTQNFPYLLFISYLHIYMYMYIR